MQNLLTFPFKNKQPNETVELENKIARYLELKEKVKEFEALKTDLKDRFEEVSEYSTPNYKITGKRVYRKAYEVPDHDYWMMRIKEIK